MAGTEATTIAISSDRLLPVKVVNDGSDAARTSNLGGAGTSIIRHIAGILEDAVLGLLTVFLFALGILVIGTPIALCVRVVVEIARRLQQ